MKIRLFIAIILSGALEVSGQTSSHIPRFVKNGNYVQLLVDNKPYLLLGGELGNSSASGNTYKYNYITKHVQLNV